MESKIRYLYKITKEEEKKILKKKNRNELATMYYPLVQIVIYKLIKKYQSFKDIEFEDLCSIGSMLMISLIEIYNPKKCKLTLSYFIHKMLPYKIIDYFSHSNFKYHKVQIFPIPRYMFNDSIDWFDKFYISDLINRIYHDDDLLKTSYQRKILKLTIKGYSTREISKMLNRPYGAISSNKYLIKMKINKKYGIDFKEL